MKKRDMLGPNPNVSTIEVLVTVPMVMCAELARCAAVTLMDRLHRR